jgi:UDP-N-acetylmuramoylalanine--D-glutamate ligase
MKVQETRQWNGKKALVIGVARQGMALARFLVCQGALVTLNDRQKADALEVEMNKLQTDVSSCPGSGTLRWILGEHPLELLEEGWDFLFVSGGVPLTLPLIKEAQLRSIPISNDTQVFMQAVPCPVIGITGSAGKTTTTTLVGRMLSAYMQRSPHPQSTVTNLLPGKVWVGGNIGLPLIDHLDEINPQDRVVLELSSFQLELMTLSPQVSAILNITPNHLDRHKTMQAYSAAKANILTHQTSADAVVLGRDDPGAWDLAGVVKCRLVTFGLNHPPAGQIGTYLRHNKLWLYDGSSDFEIMHRDAIRLRGNHNLLNVLAACAIVYTASLVDQGPNSISIIIEAIQAGVNNFAGVPHRLEYVRTWNGADWYNDSIATAPERVIAAIESFSEPLVLLLGGRDKNLPWDELAALICQRVDHVIVFGEAAPLIQKALSAAIGTSNTPSLVCCKGMFEALEEAARSATPGDVVLLSPGATSFDEFKDFEERGEKYRLWIHQLA